MRSIRVAWSFDEQFDTAADAIQASKDADQRYQNGLSELVCGRSISDFRWNDLALHILLDNGGQLSVAAEPNRVTAQFLEEAEHWFDKPQNPMLDSVILQSDSPTTHITQWHRKAELDKYRAATVQKLIFSSRNLLFMYFVDQPLLLMFTSMRADTDAGCLLKWCESN